MPLFYFECPTCKTVVRKLLEVAQAKEPQVHECGSTMARTPRPPSNQVVESLDNGFMTKRLERLADAERLFRERNEIENKKARGE